MPRTPTEKMILQERRIQSQGGLIVPLLSELLKSPLGIDSEQDASWLYTLGMKIVKREKIRQESYDNGEMVFSPSGLASCLRRVFLSKNHQQFGLERVELPAIGPHFYFFTGDFLHLKWQFAFYKLDGIHPNFKLVDCEVPIMSKRKDHGGTLDVICMVGPEPVIVDVKGLNVRSFNTIDKGDYIHSYRIQLTDYMMLFNAAVQRGKWKPPFHVMTYLEDNYGIKKFPKVKRGVILVENKGGPDQNHPAALTEQIIDLKSNLPEVKARLEELRAHEEAQEIPQPECVSTRGIDFTGCPFAEFCRKEVKKIEATRARDTLSQASGLRVARPKRRRRT